MNCKGQKKNPGIPDLSNAQGFSCSVCSVFVFTLFATYSPEPRFSVEVSLPVSHTEIYRNWAIELETVWLPILISIARALVLPNSHCAIMNEISLLHKHLWNTRISPFTKKSYLHRTQWTYYFYLSQVRILMLPWLLKWSPLLKLHKPLKST